MKGVQIAGLVLLIVGIVLLIVGFNASQSVTEDVRETLTGRFSGEVMMYIILGVIGVVGGGALLIFGKKA